MGSEIDVRVEEHVSVDRAMVSSKARRGAVFLGWSAMAASFAELE